jgi:hypothetical protein
LCLQGNNTCKSKKSFAEPKLGVPIDRVAHYVGLHYYVDKEMQVANLAGCKRACDIEDEFLCRSFLFKPSVTTGYNCQLYHMDHKTLPDGPATYLNTERPLLDNGNPLGQYQEVQCDDITKTGEQTAAASAAAAASIADNLEINPGTFKPTPDFDKEEADCDYTGTCYDGMRWKRMGLCLHN